MSENLDRLIYRNSPSSMAFAVKSILLSIIFGASFFIIIPLTTKVDQPVGKKLILRSVPERTFLNQEKAEKVESANKKRREVKKEKVKTEPQIDLPEIQLVAAVPLKVKLAVIESPVSLLLNTNFKTNMKFAVEKIKVLGKPSEKLNTGIALLKLPTQKNLTDYSQIFEAGEIDQQAIRIKGAKPVYPFRARRRGITGKVVITCIINKEGQVLNPYVETATPKGYFEEYCLTALRNYLYKPAEKDGKKVSVRMRINFPFELKDE